MDGQQPHLKNLSLTYNMRSGTYCESSLTNVRPSLFIHFCEQTPVVNWARFDSNGSLIDSLTAVTLDTVPMPASSVTVLLPTTEVVLTTADIPSKQRQRILQALPYALEEQLAEDVDQLHFALGQRLFDSGHVSVAIISQACMNAYQQQLAAHHIIPTLMTADVLALPQLAEGWVLLFLNHQVLVRTGSQSGFAIESEGLTVAMQAALQELEPPAQLIVLRDKHTSIPLTALQGLGIPLVEHEQERCAGLAQGLVKNNSQPINLLQGDYRPVDKLALSWRPWRLTAILLVLWGGLYLGKQVLIYQQLQQQRQQLTATIERIYRDTFPEARRVVNPRVQMEQQLKALRTQPQQANFLRLLSQISPVFEQVPDLLLKRLDYRQGAFDIYMEMANLQALEKIKQKLEQLNFDVQVQNAVSRRQRVETHLHLAPH
ncbi:MAG: type II secretion system protein GspL [Pseudomonadota bacterium]|nr:type II secretion system protein GspL [Pseudomonadota bacterium]